MDIQEKQIGDGCRNCESYMKCVNAICEHKTIQCAYSGELIKSVISTIEKVNSVPHEYLCTSEEVKAILKQVNYKKG